MKDSMMYTQITKKTFDLLFEKKYQLMKALLIPFILLTIIEYYSTPEVKESIGMASFYVLLGISFFITIIMSITVHRILLLDENETPSLGIWKFGHREVTFILKAIALTLLIGLVAVILFFILSLFEKIMGSFLSETVSTIFVVCAAIIILGFFGMTLSRLSLVFPAIAIDKEIDFADAFNISKNHKLLIFVCVIVIPVIFGLLVGLVYGLAIGFLMNLISQKLSVLLSLLNIFITVFTIAFLSTSYEYVIRQQVEEVEKEELKEVEYIDGENSYKINIDNGYEITFDELKEILLKQYEDLGFTHIKLNKEDSWLLKNPEIEKAYVLLTNKNKQYTVETFNIEKKPQINL